MVHQEYLRVTLVVLPNLPCAMYIYCIFCHSQLYLPQFLASRLLLLLLTAFFQNLGGCHGDLLGFYHVTLPICTLCFP